jgi:hypothetical protein
LLPAVFCIIELILFINIICSDNRNKLLADIGFIYAALIVIYTVVPALCLVTELRVDDPIRSVQASTMDWANQIWRHLLFLSSFVLGYLAFKAPSKYAIDRSKINRSNNRRVILYLLLLLFICIIFLFYLSGPVENYYESYTRFQNLPWLLGKIASTCIRFKTSIYIALLVFFFIDYEYYKKIIPLFLILIATYELFFNFGARIQVLIILIQAICLFTILVKSIPLKSIFVISLLFVFLFSIVEVVRLQDFETNLTLADFKLPPLPWELNSVFYSGLHLYLERSSGSLSFAEWPMFFYDIISIFTFNDFMRWNPMSWYHENYYPTALVAPFTLSPIAESAIWGGEFDLTLRGFINGLFFALIGRMFLRYKYHWWGIMIYVFIYSMTIVTLKYSVFYTLTPIVKSIIPIMILIFIIKNFSLKIK